MTFPKLFVFLFLASGLFSAASRLCADETACPDSYYGVCAHIAFNDPLMPQKLVKMREAGIRWVRTDFMWGQFEPKEGERHFESLDFLLDEAEKNGITVLPILDYSVPWAMPITEHLDKWCDYVRSLVTRYQDRIRYWEVWNEENGGQFWPNPDGSDYTKLLKASYETIKGIDPALTVVYGGLAEVPLAYLETTLQAGAGDYFDVMNIHPYRSGLYTKSADDLLIADIDSVRRLMDKYNVRHKPIWITEMGWATLPGEEESFLTFMETLVNLLRDGRSELTIACLNDPKYPEAQAGGLVSILDSLPESIHCVPITLQELGSLLPEKYDMLILPPSEAFPRPYFEDLCRFVENGGTLFVSGGVPFFYEVSPDENGNWVRNLDAASEDYRRRLRIGWRAFWTDPAVPEMVMDVRPTEIFRHAGKTPELVDQAFEQASCGRFLSDSCLTEGDEMIPLATAYYNGMELPCIVLYRYHDWKGQVVISTNWQWAGGNRSSVANQAVFLTQAMLLARCGETEKYFWYEFQSMEINPKDKESYFGITHADLSPKPAYTAYQTLTAAAPEGSSDFCRLSSDSELEIVSWKCPDGKKAWAVWSPGKSRDISLKVEGTIEQAYDLLGEPVNFSLENGILTQTWKPAVQYIIGPENISPLP